MPGKTNRWAQQWDVPSDSGDKAHIVSVDHQGVYACDCGRWKFARKGPDGLRPDCHHILVVKGGSYTPRGSAMLPLPETMYYDVRQVTPVRDETGRIVEVRIPQRPAGEFPFLATLAYDLMECGIPWPVIKERFAQELPATFDGEPMQSVITAFVQHEGRCIYGPWVKGRGFTGRCIVRYRCTEVPSGENERRERAARAS